MHPGRGHYAAYDMMPDGQSFIMVRPIGAGAPPVIVLGWFGELQERMASTSARSC